MSVKTEVLTDVVRILYELTHGPTYLVFKYQLSNRFRPSLHLRSETTDYTEAKFVVKRTKAIFQLLFAKQEFAWRQILILYAQPFIVKYISHLDNRSRERFLRDFLLLSGLTKNAFRFTRSLLGDQIEMKPAYMKLPTFFNPHQIFTENRRAI